MLALTEKGRADLPPEPESGSTDEYKAMIGSMYGAKVVKPASPYGVMISSTPDEHGILGGSYSIGTKGTDPSPPPSTAAEVNNRKAEYMKYLRQYIERKKK